MAKRGRFGLVSWRRAFMMGMLFVSVVLAASCAREVKAQPAAVEEIRFQSGAFSLVGDLHLPEGKPPFPLVILVHGSGPTDRYSGGSYLPVIDRMQRAGYAVFSWDKPGSGESTGTLDERHVFEQRAQILLDAIQAMKGRADIDSSRIGIAGISQAGYVMPRALMENRDVAFMICVSCAGNASVDQGSYLAASQRLCGGVEQANQARLELLLAELSRTRTYTSYEGYVQYHQVLSELAELGKAGTSWKVRPVSSLAQWEQTDAANESYWNPMPVIEQMEFPILAFFGTKDTQVDPVQGAAAYEQALARGGNVRSRVVMIEGANHGMVLCKTGCMDELAGKSLQDVTIAPLFLDTIESWLVGLNADSSPQKVR